MSETTTWTIDGLFDRVQAIFLKVGMGEVQAAATARAVVAGERDACKSHGIYRIEGVLRTVKLGAANKRAVPTELPSLFPPIVRVSAGGGFANAAIEFGAPLLAARAKTSGLAALVINDAVHFSALWLEAEMMADLGLACLAMCPSYSTVAPAGGRKPLLGTNPFAFGWPRQGHPPYVFDFATSIAARGEVELHQRAGKPLPEGWAVDAAGQPTTDAAAALQGAMLSFGGHKGSAIGTMIELLAGTLIGDNTSPEALALHGTTAVLPRHGELIVAFSPDAFARGGQGGSDQSAEALFASILGQGARLPSQRRYAAREVSKRDGILLSRAETERLDRFFAQGLDAV